MKKLLTLLVCIALIAGIVLSAAQLGDAFASLEFPSFSDFFTKEAEFCTLTVQAGPGGRVEGAQPQYQKGETVTLLAVPEDGYVFAGWFRGQSTYLSTAKSYSFVIEEDTVLSANFAEKPEKMEGQSLSYDELFGCAPDFAFTVYCDREDAQDYLINNLQVVDSDLLGTEWESQGKINFTVTKGQAEGEYLITPAEGTAYAPGVTYAAVLPEEQESTTGSFLAPENDQSTLNFTIQEDNKEEITYRDGIAYLSDRVLEVVDDGLAAGDAGDAEDYIVVRGQLALAEGTIFCVYGGAEADGRPLLDENAFFGKVERVSQDGTGTRIYYGLPGLTDIYEKLNVVYSGGVDLESAGAAISGKTAKKLRSMVLSNENFQHYAAAAQQAVVKTYGGSYQVPLLSGENFSDRIQIVVDPVINGDKATVDIQVTLTVPVQEQGSGRTVAQFAFRMDIYKEIELSTYFKLQERQLPGVPVDIESYDFNIGVTEKETFTLDVSFSGDGSLNFDNWQENFSAEFEKLLANKEPIFDSIGDVFAENGYEPQTQTRLPLFHLDQTVGMAAFSMDVEMSLYLNLAANLHYTAESVKNMTVGIRSSASGPVTYKGFTNQAAADGLTAAGNAEIGTGVCVDAQISVTGLSKQLEVDMAFESVLEHTIGGCVDLNSAVYAGFAEAVGRWNAEVEYRLMDTKGSQSMASAGTEKPVFSYGYRQTVVGYDKAAALSDPKTGLIAIVDSPAELFDFDILKVSVLDAATGQRSARSLKEFLGNCQVSVTTQQYLTYDAATGRLVVAENAPAYFAETIVISVEAENVGWKKLEENAANCILPAITLTVLYGDEDAYLESSDSDLEKEFRVLYRQYSAENASFLRENFKQILSQVQVPEEFKALADSLINNYMKNLFDTIGQYRSQETPGSRDMENKFVKGETVPFALTMEIMNRINGKDQFQKAEIIDWVDQLLVSEAMYKTVLEFAETDACKTLAEKFETANQATRDTVQEALSEFEATHTGNDHALQLAQTVRKILGL